MAAFLSFHKLHVVENISLLFNNPMKTFRHGESIDFQSNSLTKICQTFLGFILFFKYPCICPRYEVDAQGDPGTRVSQPLGLPGDLSGSYQGCLD